MSTRRAELLFRSENHRATRAKLGVHRVALFLCCALPPLFINTFTLLQPWVNPVELYRDPLLAADAKIRWLASMPGGFPEGCCNYFWLGAVSNIGILVWAATAGMLLVPLAVPLLRERSTRDRRRLLFTSLFLTVLLAVDDVFQIHEQPELVGPLKGEWLLYPLFALLVGLYFRFTRGAGGTGRYLLLLAVACFAVSLLADQLLPQRGVTVLIEDSSKLFGIFFWAGYHLLLAVASVVEVTTDAAEADSPPPATALRNADR